MRTVTLEQDVQVAPGDDLLQLNKNHRRFKFIHLLFYLTEIEMIRTMNTQPVSLFKKINLPVFTSIYIDIYLYR